jgi:hypothetical protein
MRNGVLIFSPWQPPVTGYFFGFLFYITLLNYNKTKCNKKTPVRIIYRGIYRPEKERAALALPYKDSPTNTTFTVKRW